MDKSAKIEELKNELAEYRKQRLAILKSGASWSLKNGDDTRAITNVSIAVLNKLISDTERQIAEYESAESGKYSGAIRLVAEV